MIAKMRRFFRLWFGDHLSTGAFVDSMDFASRHQLADPTVPVMGQAFLSRVRKFTRQACHDVGLDTEQLRVVAYVGHDVRMGPFVVVELQVLLSDAREFATIEAAAEREVGRKLGELILPPGFIGYRVVWTARVPRGGASRPPSGADPSQPLSAPAA
jgi:hypothetical protein